MTRILLTGGSGFLGRYVLHTLLKLKHEVLVPTRHAQRVSHNFGHQSPNLKVLEGVVFSPRCVREYREFNPDYIIHLAAIRGEGNGGWREYYEVNVKGTQVLVDLAKELTVRKFLYCSSVGVFGTIPARLPADPWAPAEPDNFYHKSKYLAENHVVNELRNSLPFVIFRPTITYGPGDNGFVFKLTNLVRKRLFPLIRSNVKIHLLDVRTLARAIPILMDAGDREIIINIADKQPVFLKELVDYIHQYFYGRKYPGWKRVPAMVFTAGKVATQVAHLKSVHTSLRLLSESWYYDTSHMEHYKIPQGDTLNGILHYLKKVYPQ